MPVARVATDLGARSVNLHRREITLACIEGFKINFMSGIGIFPCIKGGPITIWNRCDKPLDGTRLGAFNTQECRGS